MLSRETLFWRIPLLALGFAYNWQLRRKTAEIDASLARMVARERKAHRLEPRLRRRFGVLGKVERRSMVWKGRG